MDNKKQFKYPEKLSYKNTYIKFLPESYSFDFIKRQSLKGSGSGIYEHYTTNIKSKTAQKAF